VTVPTLTVDDSDFDTNASTSFAALFTSAFGNDGPKDVDDNDVADADAISYALGVKSTGVDSGLVDTLSGTGSCCGSMRAATSRVTWRMRPVRWRLRSAW